MSSSDSSSNDSSEKMIVAGDEVAIARHSFQKTKERNAAEMKKTDLQGCELVPDTKHLFFYTEALNKAVATGTDFTNVISTDNKVRQGLEQMVEISISVIDVFCICNKDIFSGKNLGVTRAIQLLMSK